MRVHFINVGQGNMTLIQLPDGGIILYDCNVTEENEDRVISYLRSHIPSGSRIGLFINSHRDCDHLTGIAKVHRQFGIQHVWDCGVTGSSPGEPAYDEYMALRRNIGCSSPSYIGGARPALSGAGWTLTVLESGSDDDPNRSSTIAKIASGGVSVMLSGDSDARIWMQRICTRYPYALKSDVLLASHHGSKTFFDPPASTTPTLPTVRLRPAPPPVVNTPHPLQGIQRRQIPAMVAPRVQAPAMIDSSRRRLPEQPRPPYLGHLRLIRPTVTVISVGPNSHGHPNPEALALYEQHTLGSPRLTPSKIWRTDLLGTIVMEVGFNRNWTLSSRDM